MNWVGPARYELQVGRVELGTPLVELLKVGVALMDEPEITLMMSQDVGATPAEAYTRAMLEISKYAAGGFDVWEVSRPGMWFAHRQRDDVQLVMQLALISVDSLGGCRVAAFPE